MSDISDLFADIEKAKERLLKDNIEANAIMFDKRFYYCKKLFTPIPNGMMVSPEFVCGLEVSFVGELPLKADFLVHHSDNLKPSYDELLAENKRLKEENEKLEKIKEILEEGESQDEGESQND